MTDEPQSDQARLEEPVGRDRQDGRRCLRILPE